MSMGLGELWSRTLVYFGIAEEDDDYWDEDGYSTNEELERSYAERPNPSVRRVSPRRRREEFDDWTSGEAQPSAASRRGERQRERERSRERERPVAVEQPPQRRSRVAHLEAVPNPSVRVHLVIPRSFNDAQQIADKFKDSIPVILNLQGSETDLSKRLIDFASGLTYALDGGMQRIADKVFMLTPRNVELSAEERARLIEKGFFNQA